MFGCVAPTSDCNKDEFINILRELVGVSTNGD